MKTSLKRKQSLVLLLGLTLLLFLVQCSKSVEPIDRDDLVLPDGDRELVINTSNSNAGETIGNYQLEIQSPTDTQTLSPTSETHTLTELSTGLYTITSSKDGFIGQTVEFNVILPADPTSDYSAGVQLLLTELSPPVEIDNDTGGEVEAAPIGDGSSGTGSTSATMTIPPDAITEAGTTSISFTQIPPGSTTSSPAGLKSTDFGTKTTGFVILPIMDFATPVSITFALDFSPTLIASGISARLYACDSDWNATGEYVDITISPDGATGTFEITHTGYWAVVESWEAIFSDDTYSQTYTSGCSEALNENFTYSRGFGPEYSNRMHIVNSTITVTTTIQEPAAQWYTRTATITVPTRNYIMRNKASSQLIESVDDIPQSALSYSIIFDATDCHDSGGHDSGGGI